MAKTVGFACALKLSWLNMAAQLIEKNLSVDDYKAELNEYLSFEIEKGSVRLRKTRDILMNIWYHENAELTDSRATALKLLKESPENSAAIQLCMIYMTYPVFRDICKFTGRILDFQDNFTNTQLTQKLYDEWGERGTLQATCRRVSLTMKELGLIKAVTKVRYAPVKQKITDPDVISFILATAMRIDKNSYYSLEELTSFDVMFPLSYPISKELLMTDKQFSVNTFAGEMVVSLSANNN